MNLEAIYFISQVIAAVALVGSLIFVGIQIRQSSVQTRLNTRAVRAAFHHAITDSFNNLNARIMADAEVAGITRRSIESSEPLSENDQFRVNFLTLAYLRIYETIYYERQFDASDGHLFDSEMRTLRWYATLPGFHKFWSTNPISFSDEFRDFVQGLIDEHQAQLEKLEEQESPQEDGANS